jgi:hypothetical protein
MTVEFFVFTLTGGTEDDAPIRTPEIVNILPGGPEM